MNSVRTITCPACGGSVAIRAAGASVSVGCQYCGALLDVANPDVRLICEWHGAMQALPIPLGRRGLLFKTEWEVVGALLRSSGGEQWDEFLLFNPYSGYRWLVSHAGEWRFGTMLATVPEPRTNGGFRLGRNHFAADVDEPFEIVTERVIGEFYWRVRAGDTVQSMSYSQGRRSLSNEWTADEANWTLLVPVSARTVGKAFGLAEPLPPPDPGLPTDILAMYLTGLLAFMVALAFGMLWLSPYRTAFETQSLAASDRPGASTMIGTLDVSRPGQRVSVEVGAVEFDNGWVDIEVMLVNRVTQQARSAFMLVEFYRGRDSEGPWTEARLRNSAEFSAVPAGTYDVLVETTARRWFDPRTAAYSPSPGDVSALVVPLGFRVSTGGQSLANGLLLLMLLLLVPAMLHWWDHSARQQARGRTG